MRPAKDSTMLGRWIKKSKLQETVTVFWTNVDHCGDVSCGNMFENKKVLNTLKSEEEGKAMDTKQR